MQLKSVGPRVATSDRVHQRFALQRGRLTGCEVDYDLPGVWYVHIRS